MTTSAGLKRLNPSSDNNNHRIEDQDNNNNNHNSSLATIEDRDQLYKSVLEKSYGSSLITPAENINEIRRGPIQVLL